MPYSSLSGIDQRLLEGTPVLMVVGLMAIAVIFGLHHIFVQFRSRALEENEATAMRFRHKRDDEDPHA